MDSSYCQLASFLILPPLEKNYSFHADQITPCASMASATLFTVAAVDLLDFPSIIDPEHTEDDNPFRFNHPLENFGLPVLGIALQERVQRPDNLENRLVELLLPGVLCYNLFKKIEPPRLPDYPSRTALYTCIPNLYVPNVEEPCCSCPLFFNHIFDQEMLKPLGEN